MKTKLILLCLLISMFACDSQENKFYREKGASLNEVENFNSWLYTQKKIVFEDVLDSIIRLSEKSFLDTTYFDGELKSTKYINEAAGCNFVVDIKESRTIRYIGFFVDSVEMNGVEYFDNGQAACLFTTSDEGIQDGKYWCFYDDGSLRTIGWSKNGKFLRDSTKNFEHGQYHLDE